MVTLIVLLAAISSSAAAEESTFSWKRGAWQVGCTCICRLFQSNVARPPLNPPPSLHACLHCHGLLFDLTVTTRNVPSPHSLEQAIPDVWTNAVAKIQLKTRRSSKGM